MSTAVLRRVEVFGQVASGSLRLVDAAEILQLSYRQVKRLWRRYRQEGAGSMQHGSAGRPSHHAKPAAFREQVLRLIRGKYSGGVEERFGPTLASEHLAEEDGLPIHAETLRRWMLEAGLWSRMRGKKRAHRQQRPRKEHFGELVQLDGSFNAWFEQRGPTGCLMNMADDATSKTQSHLGEEETIWNAVSVLRLWIENYGVPLALYTDWKNLYKVAPTPKQELRGEAPLTQFGRMCAQLGIRIIAANSPQAKGRVVRSHARPLHRRPPRRCDGPRGKALVYESANGTLEVRYRGERLAWEEISASQSSRCVAQEQAIHVPHSRPRPKPNKEHPYKRGAEEAIRRRRWKMLQRAVAARGAVGASAPPPGTAKNAVPGSAPAPTAPSPSQPPEVTF